MKRDKILQKLTELKSELEQKYKVIIKGVFGSVAKDNADVGSDIDILVKFHEDADLFDFVGLAQYLETVLEEKVDIVPVSTLRDEIKHDVLHEIMYI